MCLMSFIEQFYTYIDVMISKSASVEVWDPDA